MHMQPRKLYTRAAGVMAFTALMLASGPAPARAQSPDAEAPLAVADQLSLAFENAASTIAPGVVSIRSTDEITVQPTLGFPQIPEEFRRFFGGNGFSPFGGPNAQPQHRYRQSLGSGFVISADGYIVTNNHVIKGADKISVTFTDGRTYDAKVIGADPQTDIAILRVDATDLTPLTLGDSDALRVGQFVVAAGSPFGLTSTITTGIVSATGRQRVGINDYEDFIQTDAAINPGNSGGPLVNLRGEVIGVNSAIATRSGGNNGIGFAIPINMVKHIKDTLIKNGRVTRGRLGVLIQDLTPQLAESFHYTGTAGALVAEVMPGAAAEDAGFKSGDIIFEFNGQKINNGSQLRLRVAEIQPGTRVRVRIFRDGKRMTLTPTIGAATDESPTVTADAKANLNDKLGASFSTLTPDQADRLNLPNSTAGVLVESVTPMSAAARAGLRPGDVITSAQGQPISNLSDLSNAFDEHPLRDGLRLTVRTSTGARFVFLRAPDK